MLYSSARDIWVKFDAMPFVATRGFICVGFVMQISMLPENLLVDARWEASCFHTCIDVLCNQVCSILIDILSIGNARQPHFKTLTKSFVNFIYTTPKKQIYHKWHIPLMNPPTILSKNIPILTESYSPSPRSFTPTISKYARLTILPSFAKNQSQCTPMTFENCTIHVENIKCNSAVGFKDDLMKATLLSPMPQNVGILVGLSAFRYSLGTIPALL